MISPKSTLSCEEADERLDMGLPNPILFVTASPGLMGSWLLLAQWIKGMLPRTRRRQRTGLLDKESNRQILSKQRGGE